MQLNHVTRPSTTMKKSVRLAALLLGVFPELAFAQEPSEGRGHPPGGARPASPIIEALDSNKDTIIDATEIAQAAAAIKKLDKNSDGKITPDEYRPQRPGGPGGGNRRGGQGRPRGGPGAGPGQQAPTTPPADR